jgi:hypothetical protein
VSWLQRLVGKLKSLFGRKSEQGGEALAPASTETAADKPAATATATEEKPAEASPVATEEPAEAPATEAATAAPEADSAVAEPVVEPAEAEVEVQSVATPAATAEVATPEAVVPAPAEASEPAADVAEPVEAAAEAESAPAAEAKRAATNPAISTLDVEGITAELQAEGPYGPGSGKPAAGGAAPSEDFTVKGKESSKLFHTEKSPYFSRTKADVWFKSEADAESAGFQAWDHKKRAAPKK